MLLFPSPLMPTEHQLYLATLQEISNTVWAAGVLGQKLPAAQLQALLSNLLAKLPEAKPQHISNCTWAVASMGQQVPHAQLQQLVAAVVDGRQGSNARAAAVALWSAAKMGARLQQQQVRMGSAAGFCKRRKPPAVHSMARVQRSTH